MQRIDVWNLKKGMKIFEDHSMVTNEAGYVTVLSDPVSDDGKYFSCDVITSSGEIYGVGAHQDYGAYAPSLYTVDE